MLLQERKDNTIRDHLEFLPKLSGYLIGMGLLCYLTGFLIANLYLGSLGVVNLDLLKARYVLVGGLFVVFVGFIFYLLYGLLRSLQRNRAEAPGRIVARALLHSIENIMTLYLAVLAAHFLAGSVGSPPVGIPGLSPVRPWSDWLTQAPRDILVQAGIWWVAVVLAIPLVILGIIAINPKNKYGMRQSRRKQLGELWQSAKNSGLRDVGILVGLFVFLLVLNVLVSLVGFIGTNEVGRASSASAGSDGWGRFIGGIVIIYGLFGMFLMSLFLFRRPSSDQDSEVWQDNPLHGASAWIYLIAITAMFIVPIYALGIYPALPQQLGGGHVLRVDVTVSVDNLKPMLESPQNEVYMVDRSPASALLLVINKNSAERKIMEVSSSLIQSITYVAPP